MNAAMLLTDWLTVLMMGVFAVVSPGPDFAITLRNSLVFSRKAGVFTALGIGAGLCVHTAYSLVGISVLIANSLVLFNIIKWAGAAYLVYVGTRALLAKKGDLKVGEAAGDATCSAPQALMQGFLTNLLNPKVTLFFLALFTQVIRPGTPVVAQLGYGISIVVLSIVWFGLLALFISREDIRGRLAASSHWINRFAGVFFIGVGVRLAVSKL